MHESIPGLNTVTSPEDLQLLRQRLDKIREQVLDEDLSFGDHQRDFQWTTLRICQSLKEPIVDKHIYIDKTLSDFQVVFSYFLKQEKLNYYNLEMWFDMTNFSTEQLNKLTDTLLKFIQQCLDKEIYILLRSFPENIVKNCRSNYQKYQIKEGFSHKVSGFITFEKIPRELYQDKSETLEFKTIPQELSEQVCINWYYADKKDRPWIENSLKTKPCFGLFEKTTGRLIAQYIHLTTGTFGSLYVSDEYKGQKLSKWLVSESTNSLLDAGYFSLLEIEHSNVISWNLYNALGFQRVNNVFYIALEKDNGKHLIKHRFDF